MAFDNTKLSYFHSFSKMPVENSITLGNAINKSGHTVTASEVWANDIPYYGKMAKLSDVVEKVQPYARKNDMCYITTTDDAGKTFQYDGEGNWVDITSKLVNGYVIKNSKDEDVLLYHKGVNLTYLTDKNNANTDSKDTNSKYNASRLWATIAKDGTALPEGETRLIEQFAGPTDKALNGLASVTYAPSVYIDSTLKTAGTDYYDYCFSGTILWATGQSSTTVTKIDCFEYIGKKLDSSISAQQDKIDDLENIINNISVTAKGGIQGVSEDATTAGLSTKWVKLVEGEEVDAEQTDEGAYPVLTIETGTIDGVNTNDKLVTASTVKGYVDTAIAEGGDISNAISGAISDATLEDTTSSDTTSIEAAGTENEGKLVTVKQVTEYVTDYVAENAKITVNEKEGVQNITIQSGSIEDKTEGETVTKGDLVQIKVENGKTDPDGSISVNISATVNTTAWDEEKQEFTDENALLVAGVAQQVINQTIINQITEIVGDDTEGETPTIGTAIEKAIADATLEDTEDAIANSSSTGEDPTDKKLVTAEQVKDYVENHAQVTVTDGTTNVTATGFEFTGDAGTDVSVSAELEEVTGADGKKSGKVTYSATLHMASVNETTGEITNGGRAVSATDAETIVTKAIDALSEEGGAIATLTTRVGEAEASATASENAAKAAQDAAEAAQGEANTAKTAAQNSQTAAEAAQSAAEASQAASESAASDASASATAAQGSATAASQSASAAEASAQSAAESEAAAIQAAADAQAAKEFVEATAEWEAGTDDTLGDFTTNTKSGVVTGSTVKTVADEVLTLAKAYSDGLHSTNLVYVVLEDNETLPTAGPDTIGKIYLVKEGNTANGESNIDALSGSYVEYMTRKVSETEYTWEKIGTTAADLSAYAKTADLNATNVGTGAVKVSQTNGVVSSVSVTTEALVENGAIKASITDTNALVKAADALEAIGLAKPDNYVASVTGYATDGSQVTSTQGAAIKVLDSRGTTVTANDLWGTSVTTDGVTITVDHKYLSNPNGISAWNSSVKAVQDNKAYSEITTDVSGNFTGVVESSFIANIQTEMINNGEWMFAYAPLTSFIGDLSSLVNGSQMFSSTNLTSFSGDLSSLTSGFNMFQNCSNFTSFSGDLSSLVEGTNMFYGTQLTSFSGDLSNLVNGTSMFQGATLTSFIGDLSSLLNGTEMFRDTSLTSFIGDLSSLVDGSQMFQNASLDIESVECIADTIRNVKDISNTIKGSDGNTYTITKRIDIGIANETLNEEENAALNAALLIMVNEKGWNVYVNDSEYNPT